MTVASGLTLLGYRSTTVCRAVSLELAWLGVESQLLAIRYCELVNTTTAAVMSYHCRVIA